MTQFERIKNMTIEELAKEISKGISNDPCDYCKEGKYIEICTGYICDNKSDEEIIIEWLESEVEE